MTQKKATSVVLTPAQAKVVRALARDRQRTINEANRMLGEAMEAMQELARVYASFYGLECPEGGRFDFRSEEGEIVLEVVDRAEEPEERTEQDREN